MEKSELDDFEKLKLYARVHIELWKNCPKEIKGVLKVWSDLIIKHPSFNKLKKYWGLKWDDKKQCYVWEEELKSFTNQIAAEHYSKTKEWMKNPKIETHPNIFSLINTNIQEVLLTQKNISKHEWLGEKRKIATWKKDRDFIDDASDDSYINQSNNPISEKLKSLGITPKNFLPPPSPKDRKENYAITEITKEWKLLSDFCEQIRIVGGEKVEKTVTDFKKHIDSGYKNNAAKKLNNWVEGKSIYQICGGKTIYFRRLLYTLKTIKFPMKKVGRCYNFILYKDLKLLEGTLPLIKLMWIGEDNYKGWIALFKREMGWEKSRISKFMMRITKDKTMPPVFFNSCPPTPTPLFFTDIINKKKKMFKSSNFILAEQQGLTENDYNHTPIIKKSLIKSCKHATKTSLLNSL